MSTVKMSSQQIKLMKLWGGVGTGNTLVKRPYAQESRQQHPVTKPQAPKTRGLICIPVLECPVRNKEAVPQPRATA